MQKSGMMVSIIFCSFLLSAAAVRAEEEKLESVADFSTTQRIGELERTVASLERKVDQLDEEVVDLDRELKELKRKV